MYLLADLPWPWSNFFASSSDSLQKLIQDINNIEFPSLDSKEFRDFWAIDFAFAVIVAILGFIAALFVFAKKKKYDSLLNAAISLIGIFIVGFFTPPVLYLLMWSAQRASFFVASLPLSVKSADNPWYTIYNVVISGVQPLSVFGSRAIGDMLAGLLQWMVGSVITAVFVFAFMGLASWPIRKLGFGFSIYRLSFAGVVTTIFLKPIVLFVLAIGASVLKISGTDQGNSSAYGSIVLIACIVPVILFVSIYKLAQKVQIEGPVATTNSGPGSWIKDGFPVGWATNRPYAGNIPQAGDTMEGVASKANWVASKASLAAKALAVTGVAAEAAPIMAGIAATTSALGTVASDKSEKARHSAESEPSKASTVTPDSENYTLNGAIVTAATEYDQPTSTDTTQETPNKAANSTTKDAVKQGASNVASGISTAASGFEKAARWTSGAQRKVQQQIDRQIKGG